MASKMKNPTLNPHDLWLASLGAVSLTRKRAVKAYELLVKEGAQFRTDANQRIEALGERARGSVDGVKAKVDPLLARANEAYGTVRNEVGTRLAPVAELFGKKPVKAKPAARKRPAAKKAVRKAATGKPAARRSVKKAA